MSPTSPTLFEALGRSGELSFDGRAVRITHESRTAQLIHGSAIENTILLDQIAGVHFEPATTLFHGHIQILLDGVPGTEFRPRSFFGGTGRNRSIGRDRNSVVFGEAANEGFRQVVDAITAAVAALV